MTDARPRVLVAGTEAQALPGAGALLPDGTQAAQRGDVSVDRNRRHGAAEAERRLRSLIYAHLPMRAVT